MGEAKLKRQGADVGLVGFKNPGRRKAWSAIAAANLRAHEKVKRERAAMLALGALAGKP